MKESVEQGAGPAQAGAMVTTQMSTLCKRDDAVEIGISTQLEFGDAYVGLDALTVSVKNRANIVSLSNRFRSVPVVGAGS